MTVQCSKTGETGENTNEISTTDSWMLIYLYDLATVGPFTRAMS